MATTADVLPNYLIRHHDVLIQAFKLLQYHIKACRADKHLQKACANPLKAVANESAANHLADTTASARFARASRCKF